MRKQYFLILDTETCGSIGAPLTYDIGYCIIDRQGNVYERNSFVAYEIFYGQKDKMKTAYYAEKLPKYFEGIQRKEWICKRFLNIRRQILEDIKKYHVIGVGAYNARFDIRALNNTMRFITGNRFVTFFTKDIFIFDIWNMACQTLLSQITFDRRAYKNNWVSNSGNVRTSAETAFRYIMKNEDFIEAHTALEDTLIEAQIFIRCLKTRKKMNWEIIFNPWKIPQPPFKEYVRSQTEAALAGARNFAQKQLF